MEHRQDHHPIGFGSVVDTVGKPGNQCLMRIPNRERIPLRVVGNGVQCLLYFGNELIAQTGFLAFIPPGGTPRAKSWFQPSKGLFLDLFPGNDIVGGGIISIGAIT